MKRKLILKHMGKKIFDWDDLEEGLEIEVPDLKYLSPYERNKYINEVLEDYWLFKNKKLTKLEKKYGEILSTLIKLYGC